MKFIRVGMAVKLCAKPQAATHVRARYAVWRMARKSRSYQITLTHSAMCLIEF